MYIYGYDFYWTILYSSNCPAYLSDLFWPFATGNLCPAFTLVLQSNQDSIHGSVREHSLFNDLMHGTNYLCVHDNNDNDTSGLILHYRYTMAKCTNVLRTHYNSIGWIITISVTSKCTWNTSWIARLIVPLLPLSAIHTYVHCHHVTTTERIMSHI